MSATAVITSSTAEIVGAVNSIAAEVHALAEASNPWLEWSPVVVAVLALVAAFFSAKAAGRSNQVADASSRMEAFGIRQSQLETLRARFERADYFLRCWRLTMATGESLINQFELVRRVIPQSPLALGEIKYEIQPYTPASSDVLYIKPYLERARRDPRLEHDLDLGICNHIIDHDALALVREALGPPWSKDRADLLRLYYFARSLTSWIEAIQPLEDTSTRLRELTFVFGGELVLTLSNQRLLASRLFFGTFDSPSFEHYRRYYGLRDQAYSALIDQLAGEADAQELLTPANRRGIALTERLLATTPADDPMRQSGFAYPDWESACDS